MTTSPHEDTAHADIAIIAALPIELSPLIARCARVRKTHGEGFVIHGGWLQRRRIAFVEAGSTLRRVQRATQALIQGHSPDLVLSIGFAGALAPELAVGDIVLANELVGIEGEPISVPLVFEFPEVQPAEGSQGSAAQVGRLLTAERIIRTAAEKAELHERHQALAVDLETLFVAQMCRARQVRFGSVRVISDDARSDLPPEVMSVFGSSRFFRLGAALGAAWHRPASVKDLWQLRERAGQAAERLAEFLEPRLSQGA